ncbi:MAG: hypothetical protein FD138_3847 [Planctomycetota bacterium]|nr:MAG: hypothetical protein FD138_3847 [Planctomycetota bacterium]
MLDASLPQANSESNLVTPAITPDAVASWGGFFAGLFNWYILARGIFIVRFGLRSSVQSSWSLCGWRAPFTEDQIYFVTPMWIVVGFVLWLRVRKVAPAWSGFAKLPIRFAFLGWVSVVLASIGTILLSLTPPFLHKV